MAKTQFINGDPSQGILGTVVTAEFLNAVNNHLHTGLDRDGDGALPYGITGGTGNDYTLTILGLPQYIEGMPIYFKADRNNTGAATLNINNLGAKAIKKLYQDGLSDLSADDIVQGGIYEAIYTGTEFLIFNASQYHASQTPAANTLVCSLSSGLIANGWLSNQIRSFENIIDLTNASEDYDLQVGEVAKINFANETSKPLRVATASGRIYRMYIACFNNKGTSGGGGNNYLYPNNTSYANAFRERMIYLIEGGSNPAGQAATCSAFRIYGYFLNSSLLIVNFTPAKSIYFDGEIWGSSEYLGNPFLSVVTWQDTTTLWNSLGTLTFGQNTNAKVLIERIM